MPKKRGQYGPCTKQKTSFYAEITKADRKFSKTFHFKKISFVLRVFSFVFIVFFFQKRSFPAKTTVEHTGTKFGPN